MKKLYLVRHAFTEDNLNMRYSGFSDCSLSRLGEKQADELCRYLKDYDIDRIYVSTLKRTKQTIEKLGEYLNLELTASDDLREMNFGIFDGKSLNEIREEFPAEMKEFMNSDYDYKFPGGENLEEMYERNVNALKRIIEENKENDNVLICSHMGTIRNLLAYLIADDMMAHWRFRIENASITEIEFMDGYPVMTCMGFIPYGKHLMSPNKY